MRPLLILLLLVVPATPALAQFPPPGIYACADEAGQKLGELSLFVAGDYSFKGGRGNSASGQLASAAADVNPLSGPLRDMGLTGAYATDETGHTVFRFGDAQGTKLVCS